MLKHWILSVGLALSAGNFLALAQDSDEPKDEAPGMNSGLVSAMKFRGIGPAFMSGRVGDIAVDPVNRFIWYIVASSGGVWKTENAGVTFKPIFDAQGSYSIGCVSICPHDRHTIWIGTGENNSQRSVGYGDGLYKSTDGGRSFQRVGLENSEHIGMIAVHPQDPNIVFVASQGPLWKDGGDRGLFKTTDGGKTWKNILEISPMTGINEVHIDPSNPEILYASSYQRRRHEWVLIDGGPESTLYKSTDGGATWRKIQRGLPNVDKGKIGLDISPVNPEVVYAIVEAAEGEGGFFRSANRGETWEKMSSYIASSPQYYHEIVCCPHNANRIYSLDTMMMVSEDGGKTFQALGEEDKHVDNHAIVIDPADENHLIIGCDGGLYESWDRGKTYDYKANLPITQFYKVAVSNDKPFYNIYGGTQDNATQGGPSRTNNEHGIRNSDWFVTVFGDGFEPAVDPNDPDTIYSQWQYGGLVRYNRKTGESVDIKPQETKEGPALRWNWDSPLLISPHNSKRLYYASQVLFRSDDRGDNWTPISPDLTRQIDRNALKVMGRVWGVDSVAKNASTSLYGNIVSLDESPIAQGLIYVGTDEGLVQITEDGGATWRKVDRFGTLDIPEFGYIHDIEADLFDSNTVYAVVNNHKRGDFKPYILKSADRGKSWQTITGDLPDRGSVYTLKQDHVNPNLLFCGTEFGCYFTVDGGGKWIALKSGLPTIMVRDLEIQRRENDLVLATFGRGFYILDDYSPLRAIKPELLETNAIFPIKKGLMFQSVNPMGVSGRGFQGANFYTAPNPEYGVAFTFHLKEELKTRTSKREKSDQEGAKAGKDTPYPSWDELKLEDREVPPSRWLTIRDASGAVVRKIPTSTDRGIVRTHWDYRHAGPNGGTRRRRAGGSGPVAIPGKYTVEVSQMLDGEVTELIAKTEFEIEPLTFGDTTEINRVAILDFAKKVYKLANAVNAATELTNEAIERLEAIEGLTKSSVEADPSMWKEIRALQLRLIDVQEIFAGDPTRTKRNEGAMPGLQSRLSNAMMGAIGSTTGPTGTHRKQYEVAGQEFDRALVELNKLLGTDIPALLNRLDSLGAPWTPGRAIPNWR
jgi:photosystem II stability/assembly factor-like uncharacterized protein